MVYEDFAGMTEHVPQVPVGWQIWVPAIPPLVVQG
jgi:hypothetical protein